MVDKVDSAQSPVVELRHATKQFGGTRALDDVDLVIERGQMHSLLGHNGSGKSTLIKILAAYHDPEPGTVLKVNGDEIPLPLRAGDFRRLGLSFVHQDLGMIPSLSVLENFRLVDWSTRRGWRLDVRGDRRRAQEQLGELGVDVDVDAPLSTLSRAEFALLAVARAVSVVDSPGSQERSGRLNLLVLDEPTVFLSENGREKLFNLIRRVADAGTGILFVSHDLDEVMAHTDWVTVLRDGRVVGNGPVKDISRRQIVDWIVGGTGLSATVSRPRGHVESANEVGVGVQNLASEDTTVDDVSFDIGRGEILGATGLMGSGFEKLPYLLFGAQRASAGELVIKEKRLPLRDLSPTRSVSLGIALIPSDRPRQGGILELSAAENVMMNKLSAAKRHGLLIDRNLVSIAGQMMRDYDVRPPNPKMQFGRLSGGNQQKALVAKWFDTNPSLILLDEPTQGVDIGARSQIIAQLRTLAAAGTSVLYCSSDHAELAEVCDRVLIFRHGSIATALDGNDLAKERITEECIGHD